MSGSVRRIAALSATVLALTVLDPAGVAHAAPSTPCTASARTVATNHLALETAKLKTITAHHNRLSSQATATLAGAFVLDAKALTALHGQLATACSNGTLPALGRAADEVVGFANTQVGVTRQADSLQKILTGQQATFDALGEQLESVVDITDNPTLLALGQKVADLLEAAEASLGAALGVDSTYPLGHTAAQLGAIRLATAKALISALMDIAPIQFDLLKLTTIIGQAPPA